MKTVIWPAILALGGLSILLLAHAEATEGQKKVPLKGVVTLYKDVPTKVTFGFTTARYGRIERDGKLYNVNSQIAFDLYATNKLSVAIQGGERAAIKPATSDHQPSPTLFQGI